MVNALLKFDWERDMKARGVTIQPQQKDKGEDLVREFEDQDQQQKAALHNFIHSRARTLQCEDLQPTARLAVAPTSGLLDGLAALLHRPRFSRLQKLLVRRMQREIRRMAARVGVVGNALH